MGKSKGGKYGHKKNPRRGAAAEDDDESGSEEEVPQQRIGQQRATVGMLPPSDSEGEEEEGEGKAPAAAGEASTSQAPAAGSKAPASKAAAKKKNGSDDESSDEDSDSDNDPTPEYLRAAPTARKKEPVVEPRSEEDIRKDLERLELIRKKREEDRLKRIAKEGWDRFAPVTEANKPPGSGLPSDHPSKQE